MIEVTIDGQPTQVEEGTTILEAAQELGISIPTLCHHRALEPYGACRVCTVEITVGDRSRLVTSCNFPMRQELQVQTASPRVLSGRKMLAELLLARCPNAPEIRDFAASVGVTDVRFQTQDELCYLCGLCVRVCSELIGQSAISFVGRGGDREVGPPFLKFSEDCIACGACAHVCPTGAIKLEDITDKEPRPLPLEFDMGLANRGSIFIPFPQAVPKVPVIDREHCLHFTLGRCGVCEVSCEAKAIDYDQQDEYIDVEADAVIVATGFDPFDPTEMPEYGYGQYPQVMTGLEFERLVSASGPTSGKVTVNGREPKEVVFIQCVGSRDAQHGHAYCSRVCCMYTAKQAHLVCEKLPDATVSIFYMDIRAFGKGFEEFYDRVRRDGVIYRRGNPSEIVCNGDKLIVRAEDTLLGQPVEVEADLVVLAIGMTPRADAPQVADLFGLALSGDGFLRESDPKLRPIDSDIEGVYLAGCCQSPKDIPDTVAQAKAAAAAAMIRLATR